ncbi:MAG: hypothetical protein R3324_12420, partial [Halobacteriales archaeon]|nr:hypothetical protein [Halobacteriales archaeon]
MPRSVYATIDDLRAILPDATLYPDETLQALIEISCDLVEVLTDQVFGPTRKSVKINGWGRRAAKHPKSWKIIEVESVTVRNADFVQYPPSLNLGIGFGG